MTKIIVANYLRHRSNANAQKIQSCKSHKPTQNQYLQESVFSPAPRRIFFHPSFFNKIFFPTHGLDANTNNCISNVNRFEQSVSKLDTTTQRTDRRATDNTSLAKVAVQCSADTFVVNQTLVLRINICAENRHLRQARKR